MKSAAHFHVLHLFAMPSKLVLIFEIDSLSSPTLTQLLCNWGYQPIVATDLQLALKLLTQQKPAVVIDDGSTPTFEDFTFVREIRLQDADVPVVLLTDQGSVESAVQAIQQEGVYHYLEK